MTTGRRTILIVDDEPAVRALLREHFSDVGYRCREARDAGEALRGLSRDRIDVILLDVKMPGMSGIDVLREINLKHPRIPVIMATAINDAVIATRCLKEGASDYLVKPFDLDEVTLTVERCLETNRLRLEDEAYHQHLEEVVEERTAELKQAIDRIKLSSLDTIHRLAQAAEFRDEDTGGHIKRIGEYSFTIAYRTGLGYGEARDLLYAAPMHDVGKIGIPDRILLKPGKLESDEWEIMKKHTTIGAGILAGSDSEFLRLAEVIALTHHEKWNGSGYPSGLQGLEIPLAGRIVAIADVFDALTSKRSYKECCSAEEAFKLIKDGSGTHFDPDLVNAFLAAKCEILSIRHHLKNTSK